MATPPQGKIVGLPDQDGVCRCLASAIGVLDHDAVVFVLGPQADQDLDAVVRWLSISPDESCRRVVVVAQSPLPGDSNTAQPAPLVPGLLGPLVRHLATSMGPPGGTANLVLAGPVAVDDPCGAACRSHTDIGGTAGLSIIGRGPTIDEVAGAVRFLLSPGADYVSGTTITVDGGLSVGRYC